MKKDLNEILDTLTPEELDTLPEELFQAEALDDVTLKRIQTAVAEHTGLSIGANVTTANDNKKTNHKIAAPARKAVRQSSSTLRRILAAAAFIALLLCAGAGVYAYAAAKKEYKNALTFFYENELSTEGLTKNEIKEVYRDFYSHSFTNDLTTDVLLNSRPDLVQGHEITGDTSEWDTTVPDTSLSDYKTPVYYEYYSSYEPPEDDSEFNPEESTFMKYRNGEKVWEVTIPGVAINGYCGDTESDTEPVFIYGTLPLNSGDEDGIATLVLLDADGNILWRTVQNNSTGFEKIYAALSHPDGCYTTFGRCGINSDTFDNSLCVNKYSKDGTQIFSSIIDIRDHVIENVALTDSGYLVHLSSYITVEFSRVLKLDSEGNLLGDFRYESKENDFFISDLCEHNGTVYISGYSTPKAPDNYRNYMMLDLYALEKKLHGFDNRDKLIHSSYAKEELLALFREQFTAVLLVCGPDAGTPQEFYSVAGSLGDEVYVANGSVCWFTKDIIDSSYSATVKVDGMGGVTITKPKYAVLCRFYVNTFNADGTFMEQKKLDLMTACHWPR